MLSNRLLVHVSSPNMWPSTQLNSCSFLFPFSIYQSFQHQIPSLSLNSLVFSQIPPFADDKSMAETTSTLCFSTLSASIPFSKDSSSRNWASTSFLTAPKFSSHFHRHRSPYLNFTLKASGSSHFLGDDAFGFYPWENHDSADSCISLFPQLEIFFSFLILRSTVLF